MAAFLTRISAIQLWLWTKQHRMHLFTPSRHYSIPNPWDWFCRIPGTVRVPPFLVVHRKRLQTRIAHRRIACIPISMAQSALVFVEQFIRMEHQSKCHSQDTLNKSISYKSYDCNGSGAQNWNISRESTKIRLARTHFCLDSGLSECT